MKSTTSRAMRVLLLLSGLYFTFRAADRYNWRGDLDLSLATGVACFVLAATLGGRWWREGLVLTGVWLIGYGAGVGHQTALLPLLLAVGSTSLAGGLLAMRTASSDATQHRGRRGTPWSADGTSAIEPDVTNLHSGNRRRTTWNWFLFLAAWAVATVGLWRPGAFAMAPYFLLESLVFTTLCQLPTLLVRLVRSRRGLAQGIDQQWTFLVAILLTLGTIYTRS